jgi:hypothetical protein
MDMFRCGAARKHQKQAWVRLLHWFGGKPYQGFDDGR